MLASKEFSWIRVEENDEIITLTPYMRRTSRVKKAESIIHELVWNIKSELYQYIYAINIFKFVPIKEDINMCTDGEIIYYNPDWIIELNRGRMGDELKYIEKKIVHMLLHGLLGHYDDEPTFRNKSLIWSVMDGQVHRVLEKLTTRYGEDGRAQAGFSDYANTGIGYSEYYKGLKNKKVRDWWVNNRHSFEMEDHRYWSMREEESKTGDSQSGASKSGDSQSGAGKSGEKQGKSEKSNSQGKARSTQDNPSGKKASTKWQEARKLIFGMDFDSKTIENIMMHQPVSNGESGSKDWSSEAGNCAQTLKAAETGNSYASFLKEFVTEREVAAEDVNSIDPMLYTYGIDTYGDVPLVEPSEVNELKKLNTLFIAIDTSGSCSGNVASRFIRETSNLLIDVKDSVRFESIYLFQCDTEITYEECFTYADQLEEFEEMPLFGFGGTDFIPVFDRIEKLVEEENLQVDGLIYLSDTFGTFPDKEPEYPVYFAVPESEYNYNGELCNRNLPDWVKCIKLEEKGE